MRRRCVPLLVVFSFACTHADPSGTPAPRGAAPLPPQAFESDMGALRAAIVQRIAAEPAEYGVAVIDVATGRSMGVNDELVLHAASTMKVPVLLELYRRDAAGEIALDDSILVRDRFRSIADTSHYTLTPDSDSEKPLYEMVGSRTTFRDLARRMTVRSSNLATNILIDTLKGRAVQATTERVGGYGMRVLRGVEDGPAFEAGMNNVTTARGLARVLAAIARCDILPRRQCDEVIDILAAQEFNDMIPAGLPAGTRVAHKTGTITGIQHDGAIILPHESPPFVLVVLSRGPAGSEAPQRVAADIARLTWDALGPAGTLRPQWTAQAEELLGLHARVRVPAFPAPNLPYEELWRTLGPIVDAAPALEREEIGRSGSGRPLYLVRTGSGPTSVLFWSQMHGDETTASRALTDLFNYIATSPGDPRVRAWAERLTILAVPMVNPDGADMHRRRGAHGIDINRDARTLATPEARALKGVQQRYQPDFGFNLHDQNPRSRTGSSYRTAAISLLAPVPDADGTDTPALVQAKHLTAHLAQAIAPLVGSHLTRYDDGYNARAFGDNMQAWGVSTVLIESGSWKGDESKHYLRAVNFAALVTALDAIAARSFGDTDIALYASLPENGRGMNDLVISGGMVVRPGLEPYRADITIDAASVGGPGVTQIVEVGDLLGTVARDTLDATGLFVHAAQEVHPGQPAVFDVRRGAAPSSDLIWTVDGVRLLRYR